MTFEFTVFSVLTTFASGNSRWICSAEAAALGHPDERWAPLGEIECVGDVDQHFPGEVFLACGAQRFERCIAVRAVEDELTVRGGLRERHRVLAC